MSLFDLFKKKREPERPFTKAAGGLSPIMPPADLPQQSPEAHKIFASSLGLFMTRQFDQGIAALQRALTLVRAIGHRRAEVRFLYDVGIFQQAQGKHAQAVDTYRDALTKARAIRPELGAEVRELARQAEHFAGAKDLRGTGVPEYEWQMEMMILRALSVAYSEMGRTKEAEAAVAELREVTRDSPRVR